MLSTLSQPRAQYIITEPIKPGEERGQLIAALESLKTHAQAFNARGIQAGVIRALEAFDQIRERATPAPITAPTGLIDRLGDLLAFGIEKRQLAVRVDVADLEQLLALLTPSDHAQELATRTAAPAAWDEGMR